MYKLRKTIYEKIIKTKDDLTPDVQRQKIFQTFKFQKYDMTVGAGVDLTIAYRKTYGWEVDCYVLLFLKIC